MTYIVQLWKRITNRRLDSKSPTIRYMFPMVLGFFAVLTASVVSTQTSYIRLETSQTAVMEGERFSINIYANASVAVNAIDLSIQFSPDKVKILSIDKGQSVLTIWTQEPIIRDNKIIMGGGTFRRGFVGEHLIATIKVEAKTNGMTEFLVQNAQLLAGDGKGTPVTVSGVGADSKTSFYIYNQSEDPNQISAKLGINISADIDGDGKVTLKDISAFMSAWHNQSITYDFNNDGKMNFIDFSIILAKSFFGLGG